MKRLMRLFKKLYIYDYLRLLFFRIRSIFLKIEFFIKNPTVYLGRRVQIIGYRKLSIGKSTSIGDFVWINIDNGGPRDRRPTVFIGEKSLIGRNNFISVCNGLVIKPYFFSSGYCSIISATHQADPFRPYLESPTVAIGDEITIGANVFMGANAKILGAVKVGYGAIIGAGSVVISDVPPLSKVIGAPARVVARYCLKERVWVSGAGRNLPLPSEEEYLQHIEEGDVKIHMPFHAASTRNGWV